MTININKDITKIKSGGIRDLTPRQMKYGILTAIIVIPIMLLSYNIFVKVGISAGSAQTIAGFLGMVAGTPTAFIGFFRKGDLTFLEYMQLKKECERQEPIFYMSTESPEYQEPVQEIRTASGGVIDKITVMLLRANSKKEGVKKYGNKHKAISED